MSKQTKTKSEGKRIIVFFTVLAGIMALAAFLMLRTPGDSASSASLPSVDAEGYQVVPMAIRGLDYEPSTIPIRAGQKVRWIIDATNAQGCARTIYSKELNVNQLLQPGVNTIIFTPTKTGRVDFSCTMGMASGQFQVV